MKQKGKRLMKLAFMDSLEDKAKKQSYLQIKQQELAK